MELTTITHYDYDHARTQGKFLYDLKEVFVHHHLMKHKLIVDAEYVYDYPHSFKQGLEKRKMLRIKQCWTNESSVEIRERGYLKVERLHDNLVWLGVPCYLRFENAQKFDTPMEKDPTTGIYLHPILTPALAYDKLKSNATQDFMKSLHKAAARDIDIQTIIMIAIVGVGAIFGLHLLGLF